MRIGWFIFFQIKLILVFKIGQLWSLQFAQIIFLFFFFQHLLEIFQWFNTFTSLLVSVLKFWFNTTSFWKKFTLIGNYFKMRKFFSFFLNTFSFLFFNDCSDLLLFFRAYIEFELFTPNLFSKLFRKWLIFVRTRP